MMPLVQAKCENCGGVLQVDSTKKAAICPYCGTPYVVQDAINNYITNIGNLHADVVNVSNDTSAKARLDAAEAFMKLHKYDDAQKAFVDVSLLTPQDYRGWWGQVRVISKEFTEKIENRSTLDEIYSLYESTLVFVPEQEQYTLKQQFLSYYQPLLEHNTQHCNLLQNRIQLLKSEYTKLQSAIDKLELKMSPQKESLSPSKFAFLGFIFLLGFALAMLTGNLLLIVPAIIPLLIELLIEIFIRPIRNKNYAFKRKRKNRELERLIAQKKDVLQELDQAQRQFSNLSN